METRLKQLQLRLAEALNGVNAGETGRRAPSARIQLPAVVPARQAAA